ENSIAEGIAGYGFTGWGNNNRNFGSIARANNGGLFNGASSSIASQEGDNFTLKDYVGVDDTAGVCISLRPPHATLTGVTCIRNGIGADATFIDGGQANVTFTNALVKDASFGFAIDETLAALQFTTKSIQYSQAFNSGSNYSGAWVLSNTPPNPPGNVNPN